jgi:hypothetical protein
LIWWSVVSSFDAMNEIRDQKREVNQGSELRDLRWWWLGPANRSWSAAELKAAPLIAGFFVVISVTLGHWMEKGETFFLNIRVLWVEILGCLGAVVLTGYLATGICRYLWPRLMTEAETNYSRTMEEIHRKRRERIRLQGPEFMDSAGTGLKALFPLVIGFGVIFTSLGMLFNGGLDLVFHRRPVWIEITGDLGIIVVSGYLASRAAARFGSRS